MKAHTTMKTITLVALTFLSFTFIFSGRLEASLVPKGKIGLFLTLILPLLYSILVPLMGEQTDC